MKLAVIGSGLMGRLLSWQLLRRGEQVSLFGPGPEQQQQCAAQVAAGMLCPFAELMAAEPLVLRMGQQAMPLWQPLLSQLDEEVGFQQRGSLVIAHRQDLSSLNLLQQRLATQAPPERWQRLNATGISQLEPTLEQRFPVGLYLPDEGQLDNRRLLRALANQLRQLNVDWRETTIDSVTQARIDGEAFDYVFDCRGMGAQSDLPTLRGVRGEVLRLYAPEVHLSRPIRLMHPRYSLYLCPKDDNRYVLGATEIESESRRGASVRSALELLSAVYSVDPAFAEAEVEELAVGLRPALPDNCPRLLVGERLLRINGLYRHGFLLAPVVLNEALSLFDWQQQHGTQLEKTLNQYTGLHPLSALFAPDPNRYDPNHDHSDLHQSTAHAIAR